MNNLFIIKMKISCSSNGHLAPLSTQTPPALRGRHLDGFKCVLGAGLGGVHKCWFWVGC